jgi:hypothetical protein
VCGLDDIGGALGLRGVNGCSCVVKEGAFTYQAVKHRHEVRRHLEGEERGVDNAEAGGTVLRGVSISRVSYRRHNENCVSGRAVAMPSPRCCSS